MNKYIKRRQKNEQFLHLNIYHNRSHHHCSVEFSLSDAIYDTAEGFKVVAQTKGKQFETDITDGILYTGDEIEKGNLNVLFERFYRVDASHNSKTGGFGIGLSVVYAIVTAHKGKITAKSEDGKSIVFTVVL